MQLVQPATDRAQITRESNPAPVDSRDESYCAEGVSFGRKDEEFVAPPFEDFVVFEHGVDRNIFSDREESVSIIVVIECPSRLPEQLGPIEQVPFVFGHDHPRSLIPHSRSTHALIAMVVGMQDDLDFKPAQLRQGVQDPARTCVDQKPSAVSNDQIDIANVSETIQVIRDSLELVVHAHLPMFSERVCSRPYTPRAWMTSPQIRCRS